MLQVQLKPGLEDGKWACLRPLCGHDEGFVNGISLVDAVRFLDRLLIEVPGTTVGPGKASELAVCDCDRLFAALYRRYFGEQIESTLSCQSCNESFELSFALPKLVATLENQPPTEVTGPDNMGLYTLPDGRRFRLPTASDQYSVIGLEPEQAVTALLQRCLVEGDPDQNTEALEVAMDEVGAVLDLDLEAHCPECDASQTVRFNMQTYLLLALTHEQRFLNREIHHIARAYGWGHQEILNLTREQRRTFVQLIEAEAALGRVSR